MMVNVNNKPSKKVSDIDDFRPHLVINSRTNNRVYVIPVKSIQDVINGKEHIQSLPGNIISSILSEWLANVEEDKID